MPRNALRIKPRPVRLPAAPAPRKPSSGGIKRRAPADLSNIKSDIPLFGDASAPILIVLDPVVGNLHAKKPFNTTQFEWIKERIKGAGLGSSDVLFLSSAPPVSGDTWKQNKLIGAHMREHFLEFHKIVNAIKPRMIVTMGAKATQQVVGRAVQITKMRGQPIIDSEVVGGIPVVPVFSPFYAQAHPEHDTVFKTDLNTVARIHKHNYDLDASAKKAVGKYKWVRDIQFLLDLKPKQLVVDVETLGLRPYEKGNALLTVQICWKKGHAVIIPIEYNRGKLRHHDDFEPMSDDELDKVVRQLKTLLENPKVEVTGQNFKYDWLWLYYALGIEVKNYKHDTILLAHLHDENVNSQNLDDLVRIHVPEMAGFNDVYNTDPAHQGKTRMDLFPPAKMKIYGCQDTDATWRLRDKLLEINEQDPEIMKCYNHVSMPAIRAFCWIEQNGFPIDVKALRAFQKLLAKVQKEEKRALLRMLPRSIRDKWENNGVGLKPDRAAILKDYMYDHPDGLKLTPMAFTKTGQPSVSSKQAMPYYAADHPFIARIIDYIKNERLLNTYVAGFYKYIIRGRIRPSYLLHGTVTGRTSSQDPNGQNFPKRGKLVKAYRKIFRAPKGWVFLSNDLSQAELRIAAMMSGDETMLEVYANDGDIHTRTAMGVMGLTTIEQWNELPAETRSLKRFQAKAVNFGFLYGMWWRKFRSYAKTEYGIDFTEEEAQEIRELFFRTYPRLNDWHDTVKEVAAQFGWVRTYDGRVRHLPMVFSNDDAIAQGALRQAINSPVQSMASDLGLIALGRLLKYIRKHKIDWIKICGFIHDAVVSLVREDKAAEGAALVKRFMEDTKPLKDWFGWEPEIPIKADAEVGRTMSKMYELKADAYVGKEANYSDLVAPIGHSTRKKAAEEGNAEKRAKLVEEADAILADAYNIRVKARTVEPKAARQLNLVKKKPKLGLKVNSTGRRLQLVKKKPVL